MDLFDVLRACARRWYIFLPLMLLTSLFAYDSYTSAKPVYYQQAVIGLAPQNVRAGYGPGPNPVNGVLEIGGPSLLANMATFGFQDPAVGEKVVAAGGVWNYKVSMFPGPGNAPPLPMLLIETTQPNGDTTAKTIDSRLAQSDEVLKNVQRKAGVPESELVGALVLSRPGKPVGGMPSRVRSTASIFIGGLGVSILLSVVADVLLSRRRARRDGLRRRGERVAAGDPELHSAERIFDDSPGEVVSPRR